MTEILLSILIGLAIANFIIMVLALWHFFLIHKISRELLKGFEAANVEAIEEAQRILRERRRQ